MVVTHESIRRWCRTFGPKFAKWLLRRRRRLGDTWHLDEVFVQIKGELRYLWLAVDQCGVVLDILVQNRRNAAAATRFSKRLLQALRCKPFPIITDGLRGYDVGHRAIRPDVRHWTSRYLNNRAENSHWPTRRPERQMQRFEPSSQAQRFLLTHSMIYVHFSRHLMTARDYRRALTKAFRSWQQEACAQAAA
jgi:putative transposase